MHASAKKVLVIGGGFSGMTAAIELRKLGIDVDLVEIDPGWRSYGAGISLGGATLRAFARIGILDQFMARGAASDGIDICIPTGHKVATLPTPRIAGPAVPGNGAIMRPVLAAILAEATRAAGARVRLGCTFETIAQDDAGVDVRFTDGSSGRYDLVIGADGLYSKVRETLFPDAPRPAYTGQGVWRAVLPRSAAVTGTTMWLGPKLKVGVNPVSADEIYLFVTEDRPVNTHVAAGELLPALKDLLSRFPAPQIASLREQLDEQSQIVFRPLESLLMPRPWYQGRVVLIGDTVHATTPHLASGACVGIEDAIVLADEVAGSLTDGASVAAALERFQQRRWERCRMVVENSGRLGQIEITGGDKEEHGRIMRETLMALAAPI